MLYPKSLWLTRIAHQHPLLRWAAAGREPAGTGDAAGAGGGGAEAADAVDEGAAGGQGHTVILYYLLSKDKEGNLP